MFGNKKSENEEATKVKVEKLPGPKEIPGLVQKYLIDEKKVDPDVAQILRATLRRRQDGKKSFDIRIFDDCDAEANQVQVKDYNTFEQHPNLIIYEGRFNEESKQVVLDEKRKFSQDTTIFSEDEILQKIEGLSEPGSTVSFFMAQGPACGGPLGRGAAVIELAPQIPGKKQKKYTIYCANVVDMQSVGKGNKIYDSDKAKEIAKWIKEAHHKRKSYYTSGGY